MLSTVTYSLFSTFDLTIPGFTTFFPSEYTKAFRVSHASGAFLVDTGLLSWLSFHLPPPICRSEAHPLIGVSNIVFPLII